MAALLKTAKVFKISRSLFREDNGSPKAFFTDVASDDLKEIIHRGGGKISESKDNASILLCEKKTDNKINSGYLPFDFIVDCVKKNAFLNIDKYRSENLGLKASSSRKEPEALDNDDDEDMVPFTEPSIIRVKASDLNGRRKYSDLDDFSMIKYIVKNGKHNDVGGNVVWKQMESLKITNHSHQSMKARFRNKILPEIDTYEIPSEWKALLTGTDNTKKNTGSKALESFDDLENWKRHKVQTKDDCGTNDGVSVDEDEEPVEGSKTVPRQGFLSKLRSRKEIDYSENSQEETSKDVEVTDRKKKDGKTSQMKPTDKTKDKISSESAKERGDISLDTVEEFQLHEISTQNNNAKSQKDIAKVQKDNTEKTIPHSRHRKRILTDTSSEAGSDSEIDSLIVAEANKAGRKRRMGKNSSSSGSSSSPKSLKDKKSVPDKDVVGGSNRENGNNNVEEEIDDELDELILLEAQKHNLADDEDSSSASKKKKKDFSEEKENLNEPSVTSTSTRNRNSEIGAKNTGNSSPSVTNGTAEDNLIPDSLLEEDVSFDRLSTSKAANKSGGKNFQSFSKNRSSLPKHSFDSDDNNDISLIPSPDSSNHNSQGEKEPVAKLSKVHENQNTDSRSLRPAISDSDSVSTNDTRVTDKRKQKQGKSNREENDETEENDEHKFSSESEGTNVRQEKRPRMKTAMYDNDVAVQRAPAFKGYSSKYADFHLLMNRIKFLSEEYGLEEEEAALMLKVYRGDFLAVIQYFEF